MTQDTPTPLTDRVVIDLPRNSLEAIVALMQHARSLERKLAGAERDADTLRAKAQELKDENEVLAEKLTDLARAFSDMQERAIAAESALAAALEREKAGRESIGLLKDARNMIDRNVGCSNWAAADRVIRLVRGLNKLIAALGGKP